MTITWTVPWIRCYLKEGLLKTPKNGCSLIAEYTLRTFAQGHLRMRQKVPQAQLSDWAALKWRQRAPNRRAALKGRQRAAQ